ncbi:hypothetical protein L1987_47982 [Smallanthus sonchifolius]|uniref:Uncharacterized protein n=1 Tax=Smallanthus sonchifolius TaxID=185202 RepID=A0ACB9FQ28_9ASTR|nr:hypothetical protein L1987_47982 [Smallanthus sonchifolius]
MEDTSTPASRNTGTSSDPNPYLSGMTTDEAPLIEERDEEEENDARVIDKEAFSITAEFVRRNREELKAQLEELDMLVGARTKLKFRTTLERKNPREKLM